MENKEVLESILIKLDGIEKDIIQLKTDVTKIKTQFTKTSEQIDESLERINKNAEAINELKSISENITRKFPITLGL